ncbi:hypothetical protein BJX61DRAFT_524537 [Aspergillus egyptiacus]|nr:hypothetical protein BJX61DRAFT_524537 [Aspergillus egyptiacus]
MEVGGELYIARRPSISSMTVVRIVSIRLLAARSATEYVFFNSLVNLCWSMVTCIVSCAIAALVCTKDIGNEYNDL